MPGHVAPIEVETARLRLRQWRESDRAPFAALNADAEVRAWYPGMMDRACSDAMIDRCAASIAQRGWGLWAVEERASGAFIGCVGLDVPGADLPCSPCVEIGWRLARAYWGRGYATEAALAALRIGFEQLGVTEVVSFTVPGNARSRAVMVRLGMREDLKTFDHPRLPVGHPLRRHCLYRLSREQWRERAV